MNCALVISVSMSARRTCWIWVAGDRLVEHDPAPGVAEGLVVAGHGRADRAPGDAVAGLGQAHQRALEPARLRQNGVLRQVHVLEVDLAGVAMRGARASPSGPLPL